MCGFAGLYSFKGELDRGSTSRLLKDMGDQIRYRGPDGEGQFVDDRVGLCHRRLAIIDLNERSLQPMTSQDGRFTLAFNGEIYNFQDLRTELEGYGCTFQTLSDTEVLLAGYQVWGKDLPGRLRGMFAFAIWDKAERSLFLARDPFGKKPLFYHKNAERIVFGSEIKSIIRDRGVERKIAYEKIHDYLTFGYAFGAETAFEGILRLPPAHWAYLAPGKEMDVQRYWELAEIDPSKASMSVRDASHELVERFDEALKLRLVSDVPLGAFLSGGVDSSAVVARMAQFATGAIKTFSVGFDVEGFDETMYARQVADRYGTEHHSFMMDYDIIEELPEVIWYYGEPFSDSSSLVTYALSREVRRHVTVGITGDGGDEVLLGYSRYLRFQNAVKEYEQGAEGAAFKFSVGGSLTQPLLRDVYCRSVSAFREEHKLLSYGDALAPYVYSPAADRLGLRLDTATESTAIDRAARTECVSYLPGDLLVKADIATMANSLEGRSPFLDRELADWCASLPQHLRVFERNGKLESKALLKKAMEPYLPHECMYRKKMGFSVPVKYWMRNSIKDFLIDTLLSKRFLDRGIMNEPALRLMIEDHVADRQDHGTRLWNLLCLEMWAQTFIDASGEKPLTIDVTQSPRKNQARLAS